MKDTVSRTSYNLIALTDLDHLLCEIDRRPYACMQVCAVVLNDGPEGPVEYAIWLICQTGRLYSTLRPSLYQKLKEKTLT
jgi:hypothetical protein